MKYFKALLLPLLIGLLMPWLVLNLPPPMPLAGRAAAMGLTALALTYGLLRLHFLESRKRQRQARQLVDRMLKDTGKGAITIAWHAARQLAHGKDDKQTLAWLSSMHCPELLQGEILRRARLIAFPAFLGHQEAVQRRSRQMLWLGRAAWLLVGVGIAAWVYTRHIGALILTLGAGWLMLDKLERAWLLLDRDSLARIEAENAKIILPPESFRARTLRRLLDDALRKFGAAVTNPGLRIFFPGDPGVEQVTQGDRKSHSGVVVKPDSVEVHTHSPDPREPYELKKYPSLDAFIEEFLLSRVCGARGAEYVLWPKYLETSMAANEPHGTMEERVARHMASLEMAKSLEIKHRDYYARLLAHHRRSVFWRLGRALL